MSFSRVKKTACWQEVEEKPKMIAEFGAFLWPGQVLKKVSNEYLTMLCLLWALKTINHQTRVC